MKLYTEEQVRKAIRVAGQLVWEDEEIFASLPSIELPSDEAIDEQSWGYREVTKDMEIPPNEDWSNGAKWMREQILNQNK
jgi:hypothetical protein